MLLIRGPGQPSLGKDSGLLASREDFRPDQRLSVGSDPFADPGQIAICWGFRLGLDDVSRLIHNLASLACGLLPPDSLHYLFGLCRD